MRAAGLTGVSRRRGVVTTRRDDGRQAPDLIDRNFSADRPNTLWVADLTYGAPRPGLSGVHMTGMHGERRERDCLAFCCEGARAQAAVTCRQLAG